MSVTKLKTEVVINEGEFNVSIKDTCCASTIKIAGYKSYTVKNKTGGGGYINIGKEDDLILIANYLIGNTSVLEKLKSNSIIIEKIAFDKILNLIKNGGKDN